MEVSDVMHLTMVEDNFFLIRCKILLDMNMSRGPVVLLDAGC